MIRRLRVIGLLIHNQTAWVVRDNKTVRAAVHGEPDLKGRARRLRNHHFEVAFLFGQQYLALFCVQDQSVISPCMGIVMSWEVVLLFGKLLNLTAEVLLTVDDLVILIEIFARDYQAARVMRVERCHRRYTLDPCLRIDNVVNLGDKPLLVPKPNDHPVVRRSALQWGQYSK